MYLYMYPFQLLLATPAIPFPPCLDTSYPEYRHYLQNKFPNKIDIFHLFEDYFFCCQTPFGKHIKKTWKITSFNR